MADPINSSLLEKPEEPIPFILRLSPFILEAIGSYLMLMDYWDFRVYLKRYGEIRISRKARLHLSNFKESLIQMSKKIGRKKKYLNIIRLVPSKESLTKSVFEYLLENDLPRALADLGFAFVSKYIIDPSFRTNALLRAAAATGKCFWMGLLYLYCICWFTKFTCNWYIILTIINNL